MKANKTFTLGLILAGMGVVAGASLTSRNVVFAEGEKTTYDCATDYAETMADVYDTVASANGWAIEALNVTEYLKPGQGGALANADGKLPSFASFDANNWGEDQLSLRTYPMFSNSGMRENDVRFYNQYPTGWRMNGQDDYTVDSWPSGKCSAGTKYLKWYMNGAVHPGDGAGTVIYFTAPRAGQVYLKDTIKANDNSSDGVYLSIFHIPADEAAPSLWNSQQIHGLFGGTPIFPEAGVQPGADWSTGWYHIQPGEEFLLETENMTLAQGDMVAFVLSGGRSNASDYTLTSPKVIYGESSVKKVDTSEDEVHDWKTEWTEFFDGKYDCNAGGTPWSVEALNTAEFLKEDEGADLADADGKLCDLDNSWRNPQDYSLLTYPCFTNAGMVENEVRFFNQFPTGWRMTDADDPSTVENCWPEDHSACTASTKYMKTYFDGKIHPGAGAAQVLYFVAPKAGTVYATDTISVESAGSDGMNLVIYKIAAGELRTSNWNNQTVHGLYNGTPIFPEAGVNPEGWGKGWFHVAGNSSRTYVTDAFEVEAGDAIAFVYGEGNSNACDMTSTSPKVVYGTRPDTIELSANTLGISVDEEVKLKANIKPVASVAKQVEWTSSNPEVASVVRGKVKGLAAGTTTITAKLINGNTLPGQAEVIDTCEVTVVANDIVNITNEVLSVDQGLTLQLTYEILPVASASKEIAWSIVDGDDKITLSSTGLVTGLLPGEATVRASIVDGEAYCDKVITVIAAAAPVVNLSAQTAYVDVGGTAEITTTVTPAFHANAEVTVETGDATIATATWANGTITLNGVKAGMTILTAKVGEEGQATVINVIVQKAAKKSNQWSTEFSSQTSETWRYAMLHEGEYDEKLVCVSGAWGKSYETKKDIQGLSYVPQTKVDANQYFNIFGGQAIHPCPDYAGALGFVADVDGVIDYSSHFETASAGASQQFKIMLNDTQLYPTEGEFQVVDQEHPAQIVLTDVEVEKGDIIWTVVDSHLDGASDYCFVDPIIRFTDYVAEPDCVTLNKTSLDMQVGDSEMLIASITPVASQNKELTWTSSNEAVATVNDFGEVTAVGNGTCVITATLEGGASATCTVTVTGGAAQSSAPTSQPTSSEGGNSELPVPSTGGCGGSVLAASSLVFGLALAGVAVIKSKKER